MWRACLALGEQDADTLSESFLSATGELPHLTKKPAIINVAELIHHDVGVLFQARLARLEVDAEEVGFRLDVRGQGTDHGGGVDRIQ